MRPSQAQPARRRLGLAVLCASLTALAFSSAQASAAPVREPFSTLTGETPPGAPVPGPFLNRLPEGLGVAGISVAVDGAGNVWLSDPARGVISEYDASGSYVSEQTGAGHFAKGGAGITGLAVDNSTGYLYVADSANNSIEIFDQAGAFVKAFPVASGETTLQVAVDNSGGPTQGRVYVSDFSKATVQAFDAEGNPSSFSGSAGYINGNLLTGNPSESFSAAGVGKSYGGLSIAVDFSGNIYLALDPGLGGKQIQEIDKFSPQGLFIHALDGSPVPEGGLVALWGIAVDPTNGNLLAANRFRGIEEFDSAGSYLGRPYSSGSDVGELTALAFGPTGLLYEAPVGWPHVEVFAPLGSLIPRATTGEATEVERPSATLPAEVGPGEGGQVTSCRFEYVSAAGYEPWEGNPYAAGLTTPCQNGAGETVGTPTEPIVAPTEVHVALTGLASDTEYFWRVVAGNEEHPALPRRTAGQTFRTPPAVTGVQTEAATEITTANTATLNGSYTAEAGIETTYYFEYGTSKGYGHSAPAPAETVPASATGKQQLSAPITDVSRRSTYHFRLVAENKYGTTYGLDEVFQSVPAVTDLQTLPPTELGNEFATLNGSYTAEEAVETHYYFEYGTSTNYGSKAPSPSGAFPGATSGTPTQDVSATVEGLSPNVTYHYRLVAENKYGITATADGTFTTFRSPSINSLTTSHVTAEGAELEATIDPQGFATTYRFEYGTTPEYGQSAPVPAGELTEELDSAQSVVVPIEGLQQGVPYHFRVIAENQWGAVTSEDQTFEFFPRSCPNSEARQQTGANYLPDCRAYEIVSPADANGTLLYPGGPSTGQATSPSRFAFTGRFNSIGNANTIESGGDLYVSTRTNNGWVSKYVGLPGDQAGCMSGPPTAPASYQADLGGDNTPEQINRNVLADPSMSQILLWSEGPPLCSARSSGLVWDANSMLNYPSNAPYQYSASGDLEGRLPTGVASTPAALEALGCPYEGGSGVAGVCTGETTASGDLTHFVFSSNLASFAENEAHQPFTPGLTQAPGSAYDNDRATGVTKLVSVLPNGDDIPQDPTFASVPAVSPGNGLGPRTLGGAEEFIRFPAVSEDGSHILMSTATAGTRSCNHSDADLVCPHYTETPLHLYMRVNNAVTYEIAGGAAGDYIDTTSDGTRVYFTSEQQLIPADHDNSTDLYEWTEAGAENGEPLILLSLGDTGNAGNTDQCSASWTKGCGIAPYSSWAYSWIPTIGGNGLSDTAVADENGDVYFFSPEQLDGDLGILGYYNLYNYREGRPHFVAPLPPILACGRKHFYSGGDDICSETPIARFQVTPDDTRASFLTGARLTPYDNDGYLEMYSYTPQTGNLVCDSCRPDGQPPTSDPAASQNGLFLTDDGRTFFSTPEPLVPQDTNAAIDVYEYVEGRPQLVTLGTGVGGGTTKKDVFGNPPPPSRAGLVGVSADGTDVYFATYDTMIPEDHNGNFLRFYDARTGGGFPQAPPRQPCAAAEECHGPGTEAPTLPTAGTTAALTGGNLHTAPRHKQGKRRRKARRHHNKARRHPDRAAAHRGGSRR